MKKYLSIIFACLFVQLAWAQSGEGYDPQNPGDPQVYYRLTVEASPKKGGSVSPSSMQQLSAGATTYCNATANAGYKFKQWMVGDKVVSKESNFTYTMPEENVTLIAYFDWVGNDGYNPENPGDPFADGYQHKVTLYATPSAGGSFNSSSFYLTEGKKTNVYAYPSSGYRFVSWKQDGKIISTSNPMEITMGIENLEYTAQFVYDPANPGNPGANNFNAATGELVIDDFEAGRLSSAIYTTLGTDDNYNKVKSITIIGTMQAGDFGFLRGMSNCSVVDISRTTGYNDVPNYAFEGSSALKTIILPYSVESIGNYAFSGCSNLTTLYCYATTPPSASSTTFDGVSNSMKVLVPALSLELYQSANYWKDFVLSALDGVTNTLTISLPEDAKDGRYKNMTLELDNITSGQVSRMLITDRTRYSFVNLIHNTKYNVFVKTAKSVVLGEIQDVEIVDKDVETAFTQLKQPQTVTMSVINGKGENLTESTDITWFDTNGNYLATGNTISGYVDGTVLKYRVKLSNDAALYYMAPQDSTYEIKTAGNEFNYVLTPLQLITVTGYVKNANTKKGIYDASVSISQKTSGKQSRTVVAKTDVNGKFTAEVYNSPASISCAAFDYVNKSFEVESFNVADGKVTMHDVMMNSIVGATVNVSLTYQESVLEGETPDVQDWYDDYQNLALSVFNLTTNQEVTQISNRYPQFVLMDGVRVGDELRLTLSSKKSAFTPVVIDKKVDETEEINALFAIKQFGGMHASYQTTTNDAVVGILYDKNGYLQQKSDFANDNSLSFNGLKDGDYTLITMGKNDSYNSIYNMARLRNAGLTENVDYTKSNITVESGLIKNINIDNVPFLNTAKFQTINNEKSSLSVNKSSIVAGNYLTFTGVIELQDENITITDNMSLVVDIPSSASFVKGSVMVGDKVVDNYTFSDNTLTVPFINVGQQNKIKFCVIPTIEGTYQPNAMVGFKANGEDVMIPLGAAAYNVQNTSIEVANRTNTGSVIISGTAAANSMVEVYDNDMLIGSVSANASGTWSGRFDLKNVYNLSKHDIYAQITIGDICITTNHTECQVFKDDIVVETIRMSHYNEWKKATETITIDYQNQTTNKKSYDFYHTALFTFNVDFNRNDTTCIDDVVVIVWNSKGESTRLAATYSPTSKNWVATGTFTSSNLPSSLDVEYEVLNIPVVPDRENINENLKSMDVSGNDIRTEMESLQETLSDMTNFDKVNKLHENLDLLLSKEEIDTIQIDNLLSLIFEDIELESEEDDNLDLRLAQFLEDFEKDDDDEYLHSLIDEYTSIDFLNYTSKFIENVDSINFEQESNNYKIEKISEIDKVQLINDGFEIISYSDSTCVFYRYSDQGLTIIDPQRYIKVVYKADNNDVQEAKSRKIIIDPQSWANCLTNIKLSLDNLRRLRDLETTDSKHRIAEVCQALKDLADGTSCFYYTALGQCELKLKQKYEEKIKDVKKLLDENTKLKNDLCSRINDNNNEIKKLKAENGKLDPVKDAQKIKDNNKRIDELLRDLKKDNKDLAKINKVIAKQNNKIKGAKQWFENSLTHLRKLPKTLSKGKGLSKTVSTIGKLAGPFGVIVEAYCLWLDIQDADDELREWGELLEAIDKRRPCQNDRESLDDIYEDCVKDSKKVTNWIVSCHVTEGGALATDIVSIFAPNLIEWFVSGILNGYAEIVKNCVVYTGYVELRGNYYTRLMKLKCFCECDINGNGCKCSKGTCICKRCCKKCKCKNGEKCTCKGSCKCKPRKPELKGNIDPSGYVYEGIFNNRIEGVTTTCYQKIQVEDMYGDLHDNIVKWDAEEYGQENPLHTDKDGFYQWFVPEGLWQVKYEKEGYETAYSEWLPVPPPQLDVNIGIVQNRQPEVKEAHAYEDGVELTFDKYMMPAYLTADNIKVSQNGKYVDGKIMLVDEEVAYRDENVKYVSTVRFVPNTAFSTGKEVTLVVANKVKSYAGIQMAENFTQSFDIEKEVKSIMADSLVKVPYQGSKVITLYAQPADAAVGKTMHAESSSEMLASLVQKDVVIDDNGMAQFEIKGELPGTTGITFSIDGVKTTATVIANVGEFEVSAINEPKASLVSGSSVYRGTTVKLTADSKDLKIWYTIDGTCPCDENGSRKQYTEPIVINSDMTLKAIAENADGDASDVATFIYSILQSKAGVSLADGWNWVSFNMKNDALSSVNTAMTSGSWTSEDVVKDNKYIDMYSANQKQWIGTLSKHGALSNTQMYKVRSSKAQTLGLTGEAVHPTETTITLGAGWNYISYLPLVNMNVSDALKGYKAENGDVIKSQDAFATYSTANGWEGDLTTMTVGRGYMLKRGVNASQVSFTYPVESFDSSVKAAAPAKSYRYADNMNIIGEVEGINIEDGDSLVAYVNGEIRGASRLERNHKVFLTIQGDEDAKVAMVLVRDGEIIATASNMIGYQSNNVLGTSDAPTAITFVTDDSRLDGNVGNVKAIYGINGIKMNTRRLNNIPSGTYIIYSEKNGNTCVTKFIK